MSKDGIPGVSGFGSVDPAPPSKANNVPELRAILLDEEKKMFLRMRSVFSLRNERSEDSVKALCDAFCSSSALLRHELAYVLGQMQNASAVPKLIEILSDENEHVMVRHEAAEALGAIGDRSAIPVLEMFLYDALPEVAESCEVALDLLALCDSTSDVQW
ncbi:MAG: HEAT repeat domain-containing protein [Euryarchaeota archaeon]|jgi:deoxyhypusine monooxygenase|nr:HEAT repeat domain-containing protein [Euryarchaeota archaeon]MBT5183713.1 HEAT repeat domain-containing protein [Euryarchaeota archaeon]